MAAADEAIATGAVVLRVVGPADRESLLTRLDLAERLRQRARQSPKPVAIAVRGADTDLLPRTRVNKVDKKTLRERIAATVTS